MTAREVKTRINRRAYELLADGEWHDLELVISDLIRLVPPGEAIRRAQRRRKRDRERHGVALDRPPHRPITTEGDVRIGARHDVRETLSGSRSFEVDGGKVRSIGVPTVVRGDRRLAEQVQPMFDALASTFSGAKMDWAVEQVRQTVHEAGFHLTSCPKGCELLPLGKRDADE